MFLERKLENSFFKLFLAACGKNDLHQHSQYSERILNKIAKYIKHTQDERVRTRGSKYILHEIID